MNRDVADVLVGQVQRIRDRAEPQQRLDADHAQAIEDDECEDPVERCDEELRLGTQQRFDHERRQNDEDHHPGGVRAQPIEHDAGEEQMPVVNQKQRRNRLG